MATTGSDLRRLRQARGVGMRQIAKALGHQIGAVQGVERAARPRPETVTRYLAALERVAADRRVRDMEKTFEGRLAVLDRARGLVEELARVLVDAATDRSPEKPTTPVRPSTTGAAAGARSAPDETGYTS